jgi:hypothetical protein
MHASFDIDIDSILAKFKDFDAARLHVQKHLAYINEVKAMVQTDEDLAKEDVVEA